jgi:pimeloyl-ACP methyl ester carboxylesterase
VKLNSLKPLLSLTALLSIWSGGAWAQSVETPELLEPHLIRLDNGRRLNMVCFGKGAPTVVFEHGGDGSILDWRKVERPISAMTRACFYNRAGFGISDPPDKPLTGIAVTDDLKALLQKANITGPIVIVGHSIGGFYATLFADRFPSLVAGLVLLDPGFAGQFNPKTAEAREKGLNGMARGTVKLHICAALAREGKISATDTQGCFMLHLGSTPDEAKYVTDMFTKPYWFEAEASQSEHYFPNSDAETEDWLEEREAHRSFGNIPIVVLSAGRVAENRNSWETDADVQEFIELWRQGHKDLAARSARGEFAIVPDAAHFIQLDAPQRTIDAIAKVVAEVRAGQQ